MLALEVDGVALHHAVEGREGTPWLVLAHSLGTDLRSWDAVAARLRERFRVLRHDLRGHGLSDAPAGDCTIERHADDLAGLMDRLGVRAAVVCGVSIGGMIAVSLAARRPELVRALVPCDTGHRIGTPAAWQERIDAIRRGGLAAVAEAVLERWFGDGYRRAHAAALPAWRNLLLRTPVEGYLASCAAIRDADLGGAAASLRSPTLCLCGSEDRATPPDLVGELARRIPGAGFAELAGAAHLPNVEQPEELAARIASFVRDREGVQA